MVGTQSLSKIEGGKRCLLKLIDNQESGYREVRTGLHKETLIFYWRLSTPSLGKSHFFRLFEFTR
jgi:hypothetical protein